MKKAGMMENWKTGMMGNPKITVTPAEAGVLTHTNLLDSHRSLPRTLIRGGNDKIDEMTTS